jgi:hypothetical protein
MSPAFSFSKLSRSASFRTVANTFQPSFAKCSAVTRPKPVEQPVMRMDFIFSLLWSKVSLMTIIEIVVYAIEKYIYWYMSEHNIVDQLMRIPNQSLS